jgi:hypothetical protein
MHTLDATFGAVDVQAPMPQIDLRPTQRTQFLGTQTVPIRHQDCRCIAWAITPSLPRSFDQPLHFRFR